MRARRMAVLAAALATTVLLAITASGAFARDAGGPRNGPRGTEHTRQAESGGSGHDKPSPAAGPPAAGPSAAVTPSAAAPPNPHESGGKTTGEAAVQSTNGSGTKKVSGFTLADLAAVAAGGSAPVAATAAPAGPEPPTVSPAGAPSRSTPAIGGAILSVSPVLGAAAPAVAAAVTPTPSGASELPATVAPASPAAAAHAAPQVTHLGSSLVPSDATVIPSAARGVLDSPAGRSLTAVFAILAGIAVFLLTHRRVARHDPKLAAASAEHDLARFR